MHRLPGAQTCAGEGAIQRHRAAEGGTLRSVASGRAQRIVVGEIHSRPRPLTEPGGVLGEQREHAVELQRLVDALNDFGQRMRIAYAPLCGGLVNPRRTSVDLEEYRVIA